MRPVRGLSGSGTFSMVMVRSEESDVTRTVWVLHRPEKERADLVEVLNGNAPPPDLTLALIAELDPAHFLRHAHY